MLRLKSVLVLFTLIVLTALALPARALAQSSWPTMGNITIEVVDENGNPIGGLWYLHEGTGDRGIVLRNGTLEETFSMVYGTYFLRAEHVDGYESFEIVSENPQTILPHGMITFRLVYQSAEVQGEDLTGGTSEEAGAASDEEISAAETEAAVEEEPAPAQAEESNVSASRNLPPRTPLHVSTPLRERLSYTGEPVGVVFGQPVQLAVTGPGSLIGLLLFSGSLSGIFMRRRGQ